MKAKIELFPAMNPNPVLTVEKDGTVLYSNEAGEPLLNEWNVEIGEKLPSYIGGFMQRTISRNSPEKMEVKAGKKVYLLAFHPSSEDECVNIYGFDVSNLKEPDETVMESEAQEMANVGLAEIIDIQEIQSLMNEFYKITHIPIGLNDTKGNILVSTGWQDICIKFHRVHPEACKHCVESDTKLTAGILPGEIKLYKCKNNMWDIATPIIVSSQYVGYVFSGQFFFNDEPLDYELFRSQARIYGFNEEQYIAALEKVPRLSREVVNTGMSFFMMFANMISQLSYSNIKLAQSLAKRNALVNALVESEERERARSNELTTILDAVPAAVWIAHDPKALKITGNRLSYEWLRLPEGANLSKAAPEGERPETYRLLKDGVEIPLEDMPVRMSASGKEVRDYEFDLVYPDGKMLHLLGNVKPLLNEHGNPQGAVSAFIDITERKQAEEEVKDTSNILQLIMNNIPQGIFWKDRNSRYMGCNKVFAKAAGAESPENIVGKTDYDLPWLREQTDWYREYDHRIMENDTSEYHIVESLRKADGELAWVETNKIPLHDTKGNVIGILGTYEDITEHKQAEEEVKDTNNMLQLIMNNIPQGIFWKDRNSRYMGCNKVFAKAAGVESPENIVGKTDYNLPWLREQTDWYRGYDHRIMKNDTPEYHIVESLRKADGELAWVETNKIPLHDTKGNVIGILGTYEDITERKQAEEALRSSMARLCLALDAANAGTWEWNLKTNDNIWSEELWRLYGLEPHCCKPSYEAWLQIIHPADRESVERKVQEAAVSGTELNIKWRVPHPDGTERWLMSRGRPLHDACGQVESYIGVVVDITELKRAEEALKKAHDSLEENVKERTAELEEAYDSLLENDLRLREAQKIAHLGNWDWNLLTDELYWSDELYRIFGLDLLESSVTYDAFLSHVDQEDRSYVDNATQKALNGDLYSIEYMITLPDGEKRIVHSQGEVFFDEKCTPVRMRGTVQDITERKKAEEKIKILAHAVESSNDAIITKSLDGIITSWNRGAEQVYGYSSREVLGRPISILEPSILSGETERLAEMVKQGEKIQQYETSRLRRDGKIIYVSITVSPVFNINGKLSAISVISRDITKRKESEEALAKIEIARKQEIHHRIKNNLQVISSLLDLQAEQFKDKECIKDSEVMEAFKESQNRVISMALIHEELHKGGGFETLNFSPYIEELVENLFKTYSFGNTDICLKMDLAENTFFDMDTAVPLGMIVNELVSNSLKHAFSGRNKGEIRIKLHREEYGDYINSVNEDRKNTSFVLTVSDNGVGIPKNLDIEDLDTLGMQLVTSLIDQLDGELKLKRDNGTEFTIVFTVPLQK